MILKELLKGHSHLKIFLEIASVALFPFSSADHLCGCLPHILTLAFSHHSNEFSPFRSRREWRYTYLVSVGQHYCATLSVTLRNLKSNWSQEMSLHTHIFSSTFLLDCTVMPQNFTAHVTQVMHESSEGFLWYSLLCKAWCVQESREKSWCSGMVWRRAATKS